MVISCDIDLKVKIHQEADTDFYPDMLKNMLDTVAIRHRTKKLVEQCIANQMVDDLGNNKVEVVVGEVAVYEGSNKKDTP